MTSGERLVIGRRCHGGAGFLDAPASGEGTAYFVDRGWQDEAVMDAFIRDYLAQAELLDQCPMSAAAIGVVLECTASEEAAELIRAMWDS